MIGELTVWLMVYASDPNTRKQYEIEDRKIPITDCVDEECISKRCLDAQKPWIAKALTVRRGEWVLSIHCQLEHSEETPASFNKDEENE